VTTLFLTCCSAYSVVMIPLMRYSDVIGKYIDHSVVVCQWFEAISDLWNGYWCIGIDDDKLMVTFMYISLVVLFDILSDLPLLFCYFGHIILAIQPIGYWPTADCVMLLQLFYGWVGQLAVAEALATIPSASKKWRKKRPVVFVLMWSSKLCGPLCGWLM